MAGLVAETAEIGTSVSAARRTPAALDIRQHLLSFKPLPGLRASAGPGTPGIPHGRIGGNSLKTLVNLTQASPRPGPHHAESALRIKRSPRADRATPWLWPSWRRGTLHPRNGIPRHGRCTRE